MTRRGFYSRLIAVPVAIVLASSLLVAAISQPAVAGAARNISIRHLAADGGTERFSAAVTGAVRCSWEAAPKIAGFAKSLPCGRGTISRVASFETNDSPAAESWLVTLTVSGADKRVERWRISEAAPQITYSASVSPGLTESPGNPFEATYTYAAGAIATFGNTSIDLATIGKLPDGVLQFVSDGSLACTTDVGGEVAVGACTITYGSLGQHAVTARYVPDVATVNAPFETSAATLHSYWTATSQNIVREQGPPEPESGPDDAETYIATYDVTADTVDQYGYAVAPSDGSWAFQLSGLADDGNRFETTITPPPGQLSCEITITATLYSDYAVPQTSSVSSPDCSGGLDTGPGDGPLTSPGNNVPGWLVTTTFNSASAGFSDSSSGTQDIVCEE